VRPIRFVVFAYDRDREQVPAPSAEGADPRATKDFRLQRPPLVLVHGFLSSPAKYSQFKQRLKEEFGVGTFTVYTPDYSDMNHSGLQVVLPRIRETIRQALAGARNGAHDLAPGVRTLDGRRYAATRVDLVGHSFGGLLTRAYVGQEGGIPEETKFRRPANYFTGDLNHVITLDTPFLGSAQAEYVWFCDFAPFTFPDGSTTRALLNPDGTLRTDRPDFADRPRRDDSGRCRDVEGSSLTDKNSFIFHFARSLGEGDMTAYRDMVPGSPALLAFFDQPPSQTRGPGVHLIGGITTEPVAQRLLSQNLLSGLINTFGSAYDPATGTFDLLRLLSTDFRNELRDATKLDYAAARYFELAFEAERSDLIVCRESQLAGQVLVPLPFVTIRRGFIHGQAPNHPRVQDRIIELLNRPVTLGEFHDQGMFPNADTLLRFPPPRLRCE
jgi:pimeloyl-ACP methyl ester carboxylesterase